MEKLCWRINCKITYKHTNTCLLEKNEEIVLKNSKSFYICNIINH